MNPPPGWHPQPDGRERYWNGRQWTDEFRPGYASPPPAAAPPSPVAGLLSKPWVRFAGVGLLGFILGGALLGGGSDAPDSAQPAPTETVTATATVTAVETVTTEATVTVAPTPEAPPATTSAAVAPAAPASTPTTVATPTIVEVPNAVGMNYQDAQDLWRSAGLVVGVATDATGANRLAFVDSNWVVVSQDLTPGETVDGGTIITATIKKYTDN